MSKFILRISLSKNINMDSYSNNLEQTKKKGNWQDLGASVATYVRALFKDYLWQYSTFVCNNPSCYSCDYNI